MKILWLANIPSPYRVAFFNELGKECELTVLFERSASDERDGSWKEYSADSFECVILKGKAFGIEEAFCPSVLKYLKKGAYDRIMVTDYTTPTGILACFAMKLRGVPYCVEGDGAFPKAGKGLKYAVKKSIFTSAEVCFSTAESHDEYYRTYGVSDDKIARYPFTSVKAEDVLKAPLSAGEKEKYRAETEMTEKRIVLTVGRFIECKGYDILLESVKKMPPDVGVYFVGGEPTEEYKSIVGKDGLTNVHFVGFRKKDKLAAYYKAADVFVLPTRGDAWGLVINEALANGLPVVTTDRCVAGCQMLKGRLCGRIIKPDDTDALAGAVTDMLAQCGGDVSADALSLAREYTVEEMVRRHMQLLGKPSEQ